MGWWPAPKPRSMATSPRGSVRPRNIHCGAASAPRAAPNQSKSATPSPAARLAGCNSTPNLYRDFRDISRPESMSDLVPLRRTPGSARGRDGDRREEAPSPSAPLVYLETYGCQMNVADSDMVLGLLHGAGYARTQDPARADLILINT